MFLGFLASAFVMTAIEEAAKEEAKERLINHLESIVSEVEDPTDYFDDWDDYYDDDEDYEDDWEEDC